MSRTEGTRPPGKVVHAVPDTDAEWGFVVNGQPTNHSVPLDDPAEALARWLDVTGVPVDQIQSVALVRHSRLSV